MENNIKLEDFLKEQAEPHYLCIITPEVGNESKVRLIRWEEREKTGVLSQYVIIDKHMINVINPTEHFCFIDEKKYAVVEVVFKENSQLPIADVLDLVWGESKCVTCQAVNDYLKSF